MLKLEVSDISASGLRQELLMLLGLASPVIVHISDEAVETQDVVTETAVETDASIEKKRKRRTKAQIEADEAAAKAEVTVEPEAAVVVEEEVEPEVEPEAEPVVEVKPPDVPAGSKVTPHILRAACIKAADRVGPDAVFAVLAEYGAKAALEVKESDLPVAFDKISKLGL